MKSDRFPGLVTDILLAFSLLSRLPVPRLPAAAFDKGARAIWAYPLVGVCVGFLGAAAGVLALWLGLSPAIAAAFTVVTTVLATGALHEDGLADSADGIWGGHTPERRLEIMKDSRIGTYAALALLFVTGLRWVSVASLLPHAPVAILVAATLSRASMTVLMVSLPPARPDGLARSLGQASASKVLVGWGFALLTTLLCMGLAGWIGLMVAGCVTLLFHLVARRRLGGHCGDILGATQQVSEVLILVSFVAITS